MPRFATLLGAVATASVLASAVTVAVASMRGPVADAPAARARLPGWQVVRSDEGTFRVPPVSSGWTVPDPDRVIFYADERGDLLVGVEGPAVLDDGYCPGKDPSNRAFAGFAATAPGPAATAATMLTRRWAAGIDGVVRSSRQQPWTLSDGTAATLSTTVIALRDRAACTPPRGGLHLVGLHLVSVDAPGGVTTLVLVRDLGPRGTSYDEVSRILASLQVSSTGPAQSLRSRT